YKQKRRQCKACRHQINDSLRQARAHFKKCTEVTLIQKQNYFGNSYEESDCETSISTATSTSSVAIDFVSRREQESLELAFAKSVFRYGLFLSLSEMEPIKDLWHQAKPTFKLPSRKKLSTKLLDHVFDETKHDVETLINKSINMCLISDGWSDLIQQHWTNYILTTPKPVFFTAHPIGEMQQNAETIAKDIEKIISEVVKTRWGSSATCLNSVLLNQLVLKLTITELAHNKQEKIPESIKKNINDEYHELLESDEINNQIKNILECRWKKIYHPVIVVVHLLDPKFHGSIFNLQLAWNTVKNTSPIAWWKGNFEISAPELCQVAIRILFIPSSSAASKRNWSAFSYIQEKKRAQLVNERLLKLVYIYIDITLLYLTDNDSNDSYKEILVENTSEELFENYLDIEETDSEMDNDVESQKKEADVILTVDTKILQYYQRYNNEHSEASDKEIRSFSFLNFISQYVLEHTEDSYEDVVKVFQESQGKQTI
ncbi:4565_t:CDS:2, partial [Scutellospora calospora]